MESNKDEALKCLKISQNHLQNGNFSSARKFCEKSVNLFPTPEASRLREMILEAEASDTPQQPHAGPSGASSATETHPSAAGAKHRHTKTTSTSNGSASTDSDAKREFTPEQAAIVKRIRACEVTDYYGIMSLKKDCGETEIKKAYRKLALQLHPDKNGAPGADEAFKMVSKAFQILSDTDKRAIYDRHGSDPDSRFSGMSNGGGRPGFATSSFGSGPTFEGEISPEDLFNMFFGGGAGGLGGMRMGGGPGVFTASFGPGGFRTMNTGGVPRRRQPEDTGETSARTMLTQLAPLILLFLFTLLSAMPNIFGSTSSNLPNYSFTPSHRFNEGRETTSHNVKYFVNQAEFSAHPISAEMVQASAEKKQSSLLNKLERSVEIHYRDQMYMTCQRDQERQQRRKEAKMGFMGIGTDWDAIRAINAEKIQSCEEYNRVIGYQK